MTSYGEQKEPDIINAATAEQFTRLLGRISPRMRVRCAFGLQHALLDAYARHDSAEAATLNECLRRLRLLLRERA